jgi:putative Mn2+ efflux pump MntP
MKIKNNLAGYDTSYYFETSLKYKKLLESSSYITNIKNITLNDCLKFSMEVLINNILIYFSAGITGININLCVFFNFIFSLIALYLGYLCINDNIFKFLVKHLNLIDGILLIILGFFEFFF